MNPPRPDPALEITEELERLKARAALAPGSVADDDALHLALMERLTVTLPTTLPGLAESLRYFCVLSGWTDGDGNLTIPERGGDEVVEIHAVTLALAADLLATRAEQDAARAERESA
ncbi:MAG: hypothetical protein AAF763_10220 [Pseudomonadota bacterium]